jgi:hypothetical protein
MRNDSIKRKNKNQALLNSIKNQKPKKEFQDDVRTFQSGYSGFAEDAD